MSNVNFESGLFPSTSSTTDPVTGLLIGDRAVAADFSAMEKSTFVGQGLSRVPSSSGFVLAKTGMTVTVKACKGNKGGYFFRLLADKDITFTSSASEQVFYIGVRLVLASYGWANFYDDDITYFGAFVSTTDLAFAKLTIPANAVTITDNDIEDLRDQTTYCGFYDQYLASLQAILAEAQALYDAFYTGNGISANDIKAVGYGAAQTLTDGEKVQACGNAGAAMKSLPPADVTLASGTWGTPSAGLYVITNSNITADCVVEILPALNISAAELTALQAANIQENAQAAGSITIKAFGTVPAINIPIRVIVRGDLY